MNIHFLKTEKLKTSPPPLCATLCPWGGCVQALLLGGGKLGSPTAATHQGCARVTTGDHGLGGSPARWRGGLHRSLLQGRKLRHEAARG